MIFHFFLFCLFFVFVLPKNGKSIHFGFSLIDEKNQKKKKIEKIKLDVRYYALNGFFVRIGTMHM